MDQSNRTRHLKLTGQDIAVVNIFTAIIGLVLMISIIAYGQNDNYYDYSAAAYIGLFSLTYLWLGINQFTGANGAALGWFALIVPFIGIPAGLTALKHANGVFETWLAIDWFAWSALWFMFFLVLALGRNIQRATAGMTLAQSIGTALLPGILFFSGVVGFSQV